MTPAELDYLERRLRGFRCRTTDDAADAIAQLRADLAAAQADAAALRELMNCYNLGGWTDSERLIKERDALRALLQKALYAWTGDGPAIVLDELRSAIADTARALGEGQ